MKKLSVIIFAALACAIFSSCIVLPDAQGGYYTYPIGGDEIEYTIYFNGDPTEGTVAIADGVPTFTPSVS
jgi:hypothetical protein